jgi:tetratricopeptide (TPR) repeat protein
MSDFNHSIELNNKNAEAYFNRALIYYDLGKYESSLQDFDRAIELHPDAESYNRRGNCKRRMGDLNGAESDYSVAVKIQKDYCIAWYNLGLLHIDKENYKEAIVYFDTALKWKPDYSFAYYHRGLCKEKLGDYKGEISDFTSTIEFKPDDEKAYFHRGVARFQTGDNTGGCEDLNKAAKLGSNEAYEFLMAHCE